MSPNNNTTESPVKIRLAIQGGGAKIIDLLASLDALQELEKEGKIKVTEIIGTSAGAIAGAFFAADIDIVMWLH